MEEGLSSRYDLGVWRDVQKEILRFTMEVFVSEWLLLVMGEIIIRNSIYLLLIVTG